MKFLKDGSVVYYFHSANLITKRVPGKGKVTGRAFVTLLLKPVEDGWLTTISVCSPTETFSREKGIGICRSRQEVRGFVSRELPPHFVNFTKEGVFRAMMQAYRIYGPRWLSAYDLLPGYKVTKKPSKRGLAKVAKLEARVKETLDLGGDWDREVATYLLQGKVINTIKVVRERKNLGLKDAKDMVFAFRDRLVEEKLMEPAPLY